MRSAQPSSLIRLPGEPAPPTATVPPLTLTLEEALPSGETTRIERPLLSPVQPVGGRSSQTRVSVPFPVVTVEEAEPAVALPLSWPLVPVWISTEDWPS